MHANSRDAGCATAGWPEHRCPGNPGRRLAGPSASGACVPAGIQRQNRTLRLKSIPRVLAERPISANERGPLPGWVRSSEQRYGEYRGGSILVSRGGSIGVSVKELGSYERLCQLSRKFAYDIDGIQTLFVFVWSPACYQHNGNMWLRPATSFWPSNPSKSVPLKIYPENQVD